MKYLLLLLLLTSCKDQPVDFYYNAANPCILTKWVGEYKTVGHTGPNWAFTDTLRISANTTQAKLVFKAQARVNDTIIYFMAPNNCNVSEFAFKNNSMDSLFTHYIMCNDSIITDYIFYNKDTLGIKYYKKI